MDRLGFKSALVVNSQAVDEHPVWSPDGDAIAVNIEDHWSAVDLRSITLNHGTWHGKEPIGVVHPPAKVTPISRADVERWAKSNTYGVGKIETRSGMTIEFEQDELSTLFRLTQKGEQPVIRWRTSLESCHGLSLSRDERYVAFVCELNGVIVTDLK